MKKGIASAIVLGMLVAGITGCSSATKTDEDYSRLQEDYDTVKYQLAQALDKVSEQEKEIASLNSEIDQYKAQLALSEQETAQPDNSGSSNVLVFDNMEMTLSTENIFFTKIENEHSELYGQPVVAVPMTVKNCGDETNSLNHYYAHYYGSQGTEMDLVILFFDDDMDIYTSLRPGASIEGNFYMLYDGDGEYYIRFSNFSEDKEIAVPVQIK